jgi:hypothetical protein
MIEAGNGLAVAELVWEKTRLDRMTAKATAEVFIGSFLGEGKVW